MAQGAVFGQYLLLGRLNRGGMAEVFLARSLAPGQGDALFAVKRTLPDLSTDRDFASMFIDEASIARGLVHPHICQIHDQGEVDGQLYIAMEFIHGKDLKVVQHRMRERHESMPYRYTAFALARIAQALDFAHQKRNAAGESEGIVHRDVSPQNVLLSYDGVPKLIDFGIAKAKTRLARTQVGILKGKLAYMSPEQASGQDIDHRADVFALGIVLYELVTGRSPFKGSSDWSTLQRLSAARHQPPRDLAPDLPARLDAVLARALAPSLRERYSRAAELAADLDAYCEEDGREVSAGALSAFMRKLFRDDYIREAARIRTFLAVGLPGRDRGAARPADDTVDVTVVAPSFIEPGQDSHDRDGSDKKGDTGAVAPPDTSPEPAPGGESTQVSPATSRPPEPIAPAAARESTLVLPGATELPPGTNVEPTVTRTEPDAAGFEIETDEIVVPEPWTPPAPAPAAQSADPTPVDPPPPLLAPAGGFGAERTLVIEPAAASASRLESGPPPPAVPRGLGPDVLGAGRLDSPSSGRAKDDLDTATVVEPDGGLPELVPLPLAPMPLPIAAERPPAPVIPAAPASVATESSAPRPRSPTPMPRSRAPTPPPASRRDATSGRRRRTHAGMTAGELAVLVGAALIGAGIVLGVYFAGGRWPR